MAVQQEFVALNPSHFDVKAFDCGKPDMNIYLARFAAKNKGLKLSMTWVLPGDEIVADKKTPVAAYYTLASCTETRHVHHYRVFLPPITFYIDNAMHAFGWRNQLARARQAMQACCPGEDIIHRGLLQILDWIIHSH